MDKTVLISMFITFVTSNDVLKFKPHNTATIDSGAITSSWTKPKFCNNLDCPEYKVVNSTSEYEVRLYSSSNWVSTKLKGVDFKEAQNTMFMKLFRYIQGQNDKGEKIDMTCPVTDRIKPAAGPACESDFIMSFYMAPKVGKGPEPTDKTVYLEQQPERVIYVRQFGGYKTEFVDWAKEAIKLGDALKKDGLAFEDKFYYTAGYDAPFKFFNRHNEIWFMKK